jgi:predicted flap endonuclease-1-like 5' DNA nuclease
MTQTGWIIVAIVALAIVVAAIVLLRGRGKTIATPVESPPVAAAPVEPEGAAPPPPSVVPVEDGVVPTPEIPVAIDLSGALDENTEPTPAPLPTTDGDDLRRLKGVGPKIVALLHAEEITRYAQIAVWTDADIAAIDAKLGSFAGRPRRDNWVEQAQFLAAGDLAGYEAKYGKL